MPEEFHFITFESHHKRVMDAPMVSLLKMGHMTLNRAAFEALNSSKSVELLFDPDQRVIGLRPVDPEVAHAITVRTKGENKNTYIIGIVSFSKLFKIDLSISRRYRAEAKGDLLIIDLKQPGIPIDGTPFSHRGRAGRGKGDEIERRQASPEKQ